MATITPAHLLPENCYVCGWSEHRHGEVDHSFWSNADANAHFRAEDMRLHPTNYNPEAAYVAQHRPY